MARPYLVSSWSFLRTSVFGIVFYGFDYQREFVEDVRTEKPLVAQQFALVASESYIIVPAKDCGIGVCTGEISR